MLLRHAAVARAVTLVAMKAKGWISWVDEGRKQETVGHPSFPYGFFHSVAMLLVDIVGGTRSD